MLPEGFFMDNPFSVFLKCVLQVSEADLVKTCGAEAPLAANETRALRDLNINASYVSLRQHFR